MEPVYTMEPDYKGVEVTYNIYSCPNCSFAFDLQHHIEQSFKILCDRCNSLMIHTKQIDQYTLLEQTNG